MLKKGILLCLLILFSIAATPILARVDADGVAYGVDLAFGRRVVSSGSLDGNQNIRAVDADSSTRYAAIPADDAFFYVNLGSIEKVGKVVIDWEAAYAAQYQILMSLDAMDWTVVATVSNTGATLDEIVFPAWLETQYVKFQGIDRGTEYGYSFYSFEVYGPQSAMIGAEVDVVSSNENETALNKSYMVDNLADTRWASLMSAGDDEYVIIDLLSLKSFDMIKIRWEVSFARIFGIYAFGESETMPMPADPGWSEIASSMVGLGEVDTFELPENVSARYLKIELVQRETSDATKRTGRLPSVSTFSIYSVEIYDWSAIPSVPLGNVMEFSENSPAWVAMSNITLNPSGLILAPIGSPLQANGVVTNLASISDGDIPGFESYGTYNPAVIYDEENAIWHMIYRTELPDNFANYFGDKVELGHMSTLSYAYSYDGIHFVRGDNNPVAWPTTGDENGGGLEDPRMFKIENDPNRGGVTTYYITYTMYDNATTREGILYTTDFVTYHKVGRIAPNYGGAIKSGTFVTDPEGNAVLINDPRPGKTGKVYIIYMKDGSYTKIGFTTDVLSIAANDIVNLADAGFGSNDIEDLTNGNESCMALTNIYGPDDEDIYLMYGGGRLSDGNLQNQQPNVTGWFYALGVLKTTKSNPFELTNVRLDLDEPAMYPTDTNKIDYGLFNKCMFADSMIRRNGTWYLYYGAGDMYVAVATARADFGAGAADFALEGTVLTASTLALNKKQGEDKTDYDIEFVAEVYDLNGAKLGEQVQAYAIPHFSHAVLGKYSTGEEVTVSIDLSTVVGLPTEYYVVCYIRDASAQTLLNNVSYYTVVDGLITSTGK